MVAGAGSSFLLAAGVGALPATFARRAIPIPAFLIADNILALDLAFSPPAAAGAAAAGAAAAGAAGAAGADGADGAAGAAGADGAAGAALLTPIDSMSFSSLAFLRSGDNSGTFAYNDAISASTLSFFAFSAVSLASLDPESSIPRFGGSEPADGLAESADGLADDLVEPPNIFEGSAEAFAVNLPAPEANAFVPPCHARCSVSPTPRVKKS